MASKTALANPFVGAIQPLEATLPVDLEVRAAFRLDDDAFDRWLGSRVRLFSILGPIFKHRRFTVRLGRRLSGFLVQVLDDARSQAMEVRNAALRAMDRLGMAWVYLGDDEGFTGEIVDRLIRGVLALIARLTPSAETPPLGPEEDCPRRIHAPGGKTALFAPLN